jgi:hypothetical protein
MERFITSTPVGTAGFNISYSSEERCAKTLLKILPKDWSVKFNWCQIMFSDVNYEINNEDKVVEINYNQNLDYWWNKLLKEIKAKMTK